jgi:outer membrane biosynthesis protein TonB
MRFHSFLLLLVAANAGPAHATDAASAPMMSLAQTYACKAAEMPLAALRKGASGRTEVAFRVNEDASITEATVTASAGDSREHKMLDIVSRDHVQSCKYVGPRPKPHAGIYRVALVWRVE